MHPTTLCSFWVNCSGHFARLTCNHSYGYAHCLIFMGPIEQIDSLTDFIKYTPLSTFSCNMRASRSRSSPVDNFGDKFPQPELVPAQGA
jgi:hypothetical protein